MVGRRSETRSDGFVQSICNQCIQSALPICGNVHFTGELMSLERETLHRRYIGLCCYFVLGGKTVPALFTAAFARRVFGNADRSEAGRTWDRAGEAQE